MKATIFSAAGFWRVSRKRKEKEANLFSLHEAFKIFFGGRGEGRRGEEVENKLKN